MHSKETERAAAFPFDEPLRDEPGSTVRTTNLLWTNQGLDSVHIRKGSSWRSLGRSRPFLDLCTEPLWGAQNNRAVMSNFWNCICQPAQAKYAIDELLRQVRLISFPQ